MQQIKQAILAANVLQEGHFIFADGGHAKLKLEMDTLRNHKASLETVLTTLAAAEGLPPADVLIGVPTGGTVLAEAVSKRTGIPIAYLERIPGGAKQDFRFKTEADQRLALGAKSPRIYEDVVTTLSSVAGVVRLLDSKQDIHSLAIWRRGVVKAEYQKGVTDHYLVEELLPSFTPSDCPVCN